MADAPLGFSGFLKVERYICKILQESHLGRRGSSAIKYARHELWQWALKYEGISFAKKTHLPVCDVLTLAECKLYSCVALLILLGSKYSLIISLLK